MTQQDWSKLTEERNAEIQRLQRMAKTSAMALVIIGKAEELTGEKMSLKDAIGHLATVKVTRQFA